jgi:ribosomal protein L40E
MRCSRCEADTPDGAKFCIECGASLKLRCTQCGADVLPRAKFCRECGTPPTGLIPAPQLLHSPLPRSDTPGHLAETILRANDVVEGERKQVTGLFGYLDSSMGYWPTAKPCARAKPGAL